MNEIKSELKDNDGFWGFVSGKAVSENYKKDEVKFSTEENDEKNEQKN